MHRKREGGREAFFMQEKSTHRCDTGTHKKRRRTDGYVACGEGVLTFTANCYKTWLYSWSSRFVFHSLLMFFNQESES